MKTFYWQLLQRKILSLTLLTMVIGVGLQLAHHREVTDWLVGSVALIILSQLLYKMYLDIKAGIYSINLLSVTAVIGSLILQQWWAAIVVVLMLQVTDLLKHYANRRATIELQNLLTQTPKLARLLRNRKTSTVAVSTLKIGDKIIIEPGDLVPTDAIVLEGTSSFDEALLTGNHQLLNRSVGDLIVSGSTNKAASITAKVTALAEDSQYLQKVRLTRAALASRAPFIRLAERYSLPFSFMVYSVAAAVWVVSGQAIRFLDIIIVASPGPLFLVAPTALMGGLARATRYGIFIKNGTTLQRLAEAETIAFNKNGTLTSRELRVSNVIAFGSNKPTTILTLAASIEQSTPHALAIAMVSSATQQKLKLIKAKHVNHISGRGVSAHLKGQDILIGRLDLLKDQGVDLPKEFKPASIKQTAAFVAIDKKLAGVILFANEVAANTQPTLNRLKKLGLRHFVIMTGDNKVVAQTTAKQLNIRTVLADMLPGDKLRILETIKKRPLIFVGNGVDDAPVLTASDVGISLGGSRSSVASEAADVIIMDDELSHVASALSITKRTFRIAQQSIWLGITISLLLMAVFATGKLSPLLGAVLQEIIDVLVIFSALRAHLSRGETV